MSEDKMSKVELDQFHNHEVIDRLMIMHNHYYDDIMNHPAIKQSEELTALAEHISKKLSELNTKLNLDEIDKLGV